MPECLHCGSSVSKAYERVFSPDSLEDGKVRACPNCTNLREQGEIRTARARGDASVEGDVA